MALDESNFLVFGGFGSDESYIVETEKGEVRKTNSQLATETCFYNNHIVLHRRSNTVYAVDRNKR